MRTLESGSVGCYCMGQMREHTGVRQCGLAGPAGCCLQRAACDCGLRASGACPQAGSSLLWQTSSLSCALM